MPEASMPQESMPIDASGIDASGIDAYRCLRHRCLSRSSDAWRIARIYVFGFGINFDFGRFHTTEIGRKSVMEGITAFSARLVYLPVLPSIGGSRTR